MGPKSLRRFRPNGFVALQLVVLVATFVGAAVRVKHLDARYAVPSLRIQPLTVAPLYDDPGIVSDEQLRATLDRLRPRFRGKPVGVNVVDHALRCWGLQATFDDPECLSGEEMRRLLVDQARFTEVFGSDAEPLLIDTEYGIRVRVQEGTATSSHYDHTLASLAEVGTPLDFPVVTTAGQRTVRAMLLQAFRDFSLNQPEYEWSTLSFALYMPTQASWFTSEGQQISFDRLVERIMRQDLPQGVCFANHRMHALVMLLRLDEQEPLISAASRVRILDYLRDVTDVLVANQGADGSWDGDWPLHAPSPGSQQDANAFMSRFIATGHPMEWWALAPPEVHPPHEVLVAAGQWMIRAVDELTPEQVIEFYPFLSHGARALALWRHQEPWQVELQP